MSRVARFRVSPGTYVGAFLVGLFLLIALLGPWLAPHSPTRGDLDLRMLGPSGSHWFGTDENGVDLFSALLQGARLALYISSITVAVSAVTGLALGTIAGYFGGIVDELLMRIIDIFMAFPGILLNLAIVAVVKRPGPGIMIFALAINGWVGYARVARAQVLSVRKREFVIAAESVGAGPWRIMFRHIVPNILSPFIVQMTFGFGGVILVEASLSFLGLGPNKNYSWGSLLDQGVGQLWHTSRIALIPGAAIALVILGCNLLGDGLRDRIDPKRVKT
jgi:peptide/nickel transport system permease protein